MLAMETGRIEDMDGQDGKQRNSLPRFEKSEACQRFEAMDEAALQHLNDKGYVVIAEALDAEDVRTGIDLFWQFVENSSDGHIDRDAPQTWGNGHWLGSSENGLFEQNGIGQSAFLWHVRSRPKVLKAFQRIWSLPDPCDLIMSFDGCCAFRPTAVDATWRTLGGWYHVDQNAKILGSSRVCVQGFVSFFDQDMSTGGLAVLPASHLQHSELFHGWSGEEHQRDFCILQKNEGVLCGRQRIRPRLVQARAGDLILWDSRCVHCNVPAWHKFDEESIEDLIGSVGIRDVAEPFLPFLFGADGSVSGAIWAWNSLGSQQESLHPQLRAMLAKYSDILARDLRAAQKSTGLLRLVAYVCALPRLRASQEILTEKRRAVLLGATSTHWPDRAELKSIAPSSPGVLDVCMLPPLAFRLLGCDGHDKEEHLTLLRTELAQMLQDERS